ncbi:hypothetical protein P3T27_006893 [Kitasatospora sp. MAA19]|nr:hypothetical protein [Kitasatospora sp. MAA19]
MGREPPGRLWRRLSKGLVGSAFPVSPSRARRSVRRRASGRRSWLPAALLGGRRAYDGARADGVGPWCRRHVPSPPVGSVSSSFARSASRPHLPGPGLHSRPNSRRSRSSVRQRLRGSASPRTGYGRRVRRPRGSTSRSGALDPRRRGVYRRDRAHLSARIRPRGKALGNWRADQQRHDPTSRVLRHNTVQMVGCSPRRPPSPVRSPPRPAPAGPPRRRCRPRAGTRSTPRCQGRPDPPAGPGRPLPEYRGRGRGTAAVGGCHSALDPWRARRPRRRRPFGGGGGR